MSNRSDPDGAASPFVVFLGLLFVLAGVAGAVIWSGQLDGRPLPPSPLPSGTLEPTVRTLTDEEAIARFKELDALRIRGLEERDFDLAAQGLTTGGPVYRRLRRTIKQLRSHDAFVDEQWQLRRVAVVRNGPGEVTLRVIARSDARFFDEHGDDITDVSIAERRVVTCSMRPSTDETWLLHNCRIVRATPLAIK